MKRYIIVLRELAIVTIFILAGNYASAQSNHQNLIRETTMLNSTGTKKQTTVTYYDGLGRQVQQVMDGATTGANKRLIHHKQYDQLGRDSIEFLPISAASFTQLSPGDFDSLPIIIPFASPALLNVISDYNYSDEAKIANLIQGTYHDNFAYSTTTYDAIGRPAYISTPGQAWHDAAKGQHVRYVTNAANSVKRYIASTSDDLLTQNAYYVPNALLGTETTDEDGHTLLVFKDVYGQKILERRNGNNDTYFVYNNIGQLRFVLQPMMQQVSNTAANRAKYTFEYRYDRRGNIIYKSLPGGSYMEYTYDDRNLLTTYTDARLRERSLVRHYDYDDLYRVKEQYIQSQTNTSTKKTEIVYFYDNYDFLQTLGTLYGCNDVDYLRITPLTNTMGMLTGKILRASNGEYHFETYYYDQRGNLTDTKCITLDGRKTSTHVVYSFTDKPLTATYNLPNFGEEYNFVHTTIYDDISDLPVSETITPIYRGTVMDDHVVCELEYDNLGNISKLKRPGNVPAISYEYDLHGWLKKNSKITNDGTTTQEELFYANGTATPCYNGNISSVRGTFASYDYTYDGLNRLTTACCRDADNCLSYTYNEYFTYNANGAITTLQRLGATAPGLYNTIDYLSFTLNGNQIQRIYDNNANTYPSSIMDFNGDNNAIHSFRYDACGSLISDESKGIAYVTYDDCGYPKEVQFSNGSKTRYVYTPEGTRLRTTHITAVSGITVPWLSTRDLNANQILAKDSTTYVGNFVYENKDGMHHLLSQYRFDGGYIDISSYVMTWFYYDTDHLGSIRMITQENGVEVQSNAYYPSGTSQAFVDGQTNQSTQHPYKFSGKELDRMHGLDLYDFGARQFDPVLMQWTSIDPLCEKYYNISPYAYCHNNPINMFDPNGLTDYFDFNGHTQHIDDGVDAKMLVLVTNKRKMLNAIDNHKVIPVPNMEIIKLMTDVFDGTDSKNIEHAFVAWSDGSFSDVISGGQTRIHEEFKPIYEDAQEKGLTPLYDAHSHPWLEDDHEQDFLKASPTDRLSKMEYPCMILAYTKVNTNNMETGASQQYNKRENTFSKGERTVSFYTPTNKIISISFRKFQETLYLIHNPK